VKRPLAPPYAPETRERVRPRVTPCCAACRRGTRGFGDLPCGYDLNCLNDCHGRQANLDRLQENLTASDPLARLLADLPDLGPQECETPDCARFIGHDGDHYPTKENEHG
jgi:hypothetical protein